ncbi:MAG: hypothetical protein JO197_19170 [Acidobacteria bacterium]|nr:hypothetical protein [Acidobacteriota bacterium]MBV9477072.1 hypothetical protein [Acidobacteriota bacterium]
MDDSFAQTFAGFGCFGVVIAIIVALYPLVALGRIWFYSKQQVVLLIQIRDLLQNRP